MVYVLERLIFFNLNILMFQVGPALGVVASADTSS